jgi:hypothetical protein
LLGSLGAGFDGGVAGVGSCDHDGGTKHTPSRQMTNKAELLLETLIPIILILSDKDLPGHSMK